MNNKIIYHILIDRFYGNITSQKNENVFMGGNLKGVIEHLDYIKEMGFNTLLLSPFLISTNYHGYHTEDFYNVDPHFGTIEDIHLLIKEASERELKLMLDFVPNHCSHKHPFFQDAINNPNSVYRNWFYIKSKDSYRTFLQYKELPKFNLENQATAEYIINACKHWVNMGFDYVRIDHAIGPSFSFISQLVKEVKKASPAVKFIGEIWAQGIPRSMYHTVSLKNRLGKYLLGIVQESIQMDYIGLLDGAFDFQFSELLIQAALRGEKYVGNSDLKKRVDKHFANYPSNFELVLMLDNHDMNRFLHYCNNDPEILLDALQFIKNQQRSFSVYYGTECLMSNATTIFDKTDYADLRVREPFQYADKKILKEITSIIRG